MAVRTTYFFGSYSSVKKPFIIQINSGADSTFTIPTTGGGYNYKVSTSDGQNFTGVTGNLTITFPDANTLYDISISGDFPRIYFNNGAERLKLIDIKQWGDIEWTSMQGAFYGCSNTTCTATDAPNSYNVTSIEAFMSSVHTIHNVRLDCSNVVDTGGSAGNTQPFGPTNDSSNANIELHNLPVNIWFNNNRAANNLTSGVTFYNMILTFDQSASAIITLTAIQKNNLLSYLQVNVNPSYTTLQDWLTDIGSNWTIA